jgi:hypothetical protein
MDMVVVVINMKLEGYLQDISLPVNPKFYQCLVKVAYREGLRGVA